MSNFTVTGKHKFAPELKPISNGRNLLPLTIEDENGFIPVVLFSPLAEALVQQLSQGMQVSLSGKINAKKDPQSGYWYASLIANKYSLDGTNWVDESQCQQQAQYQPQQQSQPQNAVYLQEQQGRKPPQFQQQQQIPTQQQQVRPQAQQSQQFQQPQVNQQVEHLQQCQAQFNQPQNQQQHQPVQQSMDGFQDRPGQSAGVSQQAVEAQQKLYGQDSQAQQQQAQAQNQAVQDPTDEFENLDVPF